MLTEHIQQLQAEAQKADADYQAQIDALENRLADRSETHAAEMASQEKRAQIDADTKLKIAALNTRREKDLERFQKQIDKLTAAVADVKKRVSARPAKKAA